VKFSEMVKPEIDKYLETANFTKDEKDVFLLLTRGYTRVQISERTMYSVATIGRIKIRIENKINRL